MCDCGVPERMRRVKDDAIRKEVAEFPTEQVLEKLEEQIRKGEVALTLTFQHKDARDIVAVRMEETGLKVKKYNCSYGHETYVCVYGLK